LLSAFTASGVIYSGVQNAAHPCCLPTLATYSRVETEKDAGYDLLELASMRPLCCLVMIAVLTGCATADWNRPGSAPPMLQEQHEQVIAAALLVRLRKLAPGLPALLLDRTSTWTLEGEPEWGCQECVSTDLRDRFFPVLPQELFIPEKQAYKIGPIAAPSPMVLYDSQRFQRASESRKRWGSLVKALGNREPLVIQVSRPVFVNDQTAHLLVHETATWSSGGGTDWYAVTRTAEKWSAEFKRVLVVR
jgi:hypothetical protein